MALDCFLDVLYYILVLVHFSTNDSEVSDAEASFVSILLAKSNDSNLFLLSVWKTYSTLKHSLPETILHIILRKLTQMKVLLSLGLGLSLGNHLG